MSKKKHQAFGDISNEQEKQYEREARLQYDLETVAEANQNWNSYSQSQQDFIKEEGNQIYTEIGEQIDTGKATTDADVQALLGRWHEHLRYFYEPSLELLGGLGQLYNSSPDFIANFQKIHKDLPAFLETAISHYVDELETAALERMLAEDETMKRREDKLS